MLRYVVVYSHEQASVFDSLDDAIESISDLGEELGFDSDFRAIIEFDENKDLTKVIYTCEDALEASKIKPDYIEHALSANDLGIGHG